MDIKGLRTHFPALHYQQFHYLDNAATTHKPEAVIERITDFYTQEYATIQRGLYDAGEQVTGSYENVRKLVAVFIGAHPDEIVFTKGTTEGINFIATSWARARLKKGDEIIVSALEHHANLIPWQQVAQHTGAQLNIIPLKDKAHLDMQAYERMLSNKTKVVAITAISNAIGTHPDLKSIIDKAHEVGAYVLVDAAQMVAHRPMNVHYLNADFLVFSGHKMFGPTGVGILYIKKDVQEQVMPYQFGGGMVSQVSYHTAQWAKSPHCYEAGTPPIASVLGLGSAIQFLNRIDWSALQHQEASLCRQFIQRIAKLKQVRILGDPDYLSEQGHLVSFVVSNMHAHDVAAYLNSKRIAVRAGHFCAQPLMKELQVNAAVRMSVALYNNEQDIHACADAIEEIAK